MLGLLTGSFLFVIHAGLRGLKVRPAHYDFHFSFAAAPANSGELRKEDVPIVIKSEPVPEKPSGMAVPPAISDAGPKPRDIGRNSGVRDAVRESGKRPYASWNYQGGGGPSGSWAGMDGNTSTGFQRARARRPAGKPQTGGGTDNAAKAASARQAGSGGFSSGARGAAVQKQFASLSGGNALGAGPGSVSGPGSGGARGDRDGQLQKTGKLSGMSGGNGSRGALNGASENMKAGAGGSFKGMTARGAAGPKAGGGGGGGGGGSPDPGSPKKASGDGKNGKDSDEAGSDDDDDDDEYYPGAKLKKSPSLIYLIHREPDLVSYVVTEKLNGREVSYVSEEEAAGEPDEALLKPGAVSGGGNARDPGDPENLASLSEERARALRKELHIFLKKVENKYGKTKDVHNIHCDSTPPLCAENGVSASYLTMTTEKGAKLVMGVKYVEKRWRLYTIDFKPPPVPARQNVP